MHLYRWRTYNLQERTLYYLSTRKVFETLLLSLSKFMQLIPSWDADRCAANISWNRDYRAHKSPPLVPILRQSEANLPLQTSHFDVPADVCFPSRLSTQPVQVWGPLWQFVTCKIFAATLHISWPSSPSVPWRSAMPWREQTRLVRQSSFIGRMS
jgi:hypothetical protein